MNVILIVLVLGSIGYGGYLFPVPKQEVYKKFIIYVIAGLLLGFSMLFCSTYGFFYLGTLRGRDIFDYVTKVTTKKLEFVTIESSSSNMNRSSSP